MTEPLRLDQKEFNKKLRSLRGKRKTLVNRAKRLREMAQNTDVQIHEIDAKIRDLHFDWDLQGIDD